MTSGSFLCTHEGAGTVNETAPAWERQVEEKTSCLVSLLCVAAQRPATIWPLAGASEPIQCSAVNVNGGQMLPLGLGYTQELH